MRRLLFITTIFSVLFAQSYSYDFGPGPSYIEVDSPINNQPNWSIESWVKFHQTPSAGSWHSLFSINDGTTNYFELSCDGNSTNFNVVINGSQTISNIPASGVFDNQFHHFFVEGDGSKVSFYIDGDKKGEVPYTANFPSASVKMVIGDHLDGAMDEIRIRNISGFPGLPTARYNAEEGTWLLYQFDFGRFSYPSPCFFCLRLLSVFVCFWLVFLSIPLSFLFEIVICVCLIFDSFLIYPLVFLFEIVICVCLILNSFLTLGSTSLVDHPLRDSLKSTLSQFSKK